MSGGREIPAGYEPTALQALRDAMSYQALRGTAIGRDQIGLYRALARELGFRAEGISGAELAARRTAAAAVMGDFRRQSDAYADGGPMPDWLSWSRRLAAELGGVLAELDRLPGADR